MSDKVNFVIISLYNFFASKSALILAKATPVFKAAFILAKLKKISLTMPAMVTHSKSAYSGEVCP
jgi:hypothetical protein